MTKSLLAIGAIALSLGACAREPDDTATDDAPLDIAATPDANDVAWPDGLVIVDAFPSPGDPCRQLGESDATREYLDHTSTVVGCPGGASDEAAQGLVDSSGALVVKEMGDVTILAVPGPEMGTAQDTEAREIVFEDEVTGNKTRTHRFALTAGEQAVVTGNGNGNPFFNVLLPGDDLGDVLHVGMREAEPDTFTFIAEETGDYRVLVYLVGNAKDTGQTRPYKITITTSN